MIAQQITAGDGCLLRETLSGLNDDVTCRYSLAWAKVPVGEKSYKHAMKTSEVYFIIKGKGLMHIGEEACEVGAYDTIYIPPNQTQYVENVGNDEIEFICIVDPAWKKEDEILV